MKKYALGIDLGGTGTKFGLVNEEGQVLRSNVASSRLLTFPGKVSYPSLK